MDKQTKRTSHRNTNEYTDSQKKHRTQEKKMERFLLATIEELFFAINEMPDGIMLEVYFDDEG